MMYKTSSTKSGMKRTCGRSLEPSKCNIAKCGGGTLETKYVCKIKHLTIE